MSNRWRTQPERGHHWAYQFMAWVALRVGRGPARMLLFPICLYYLLFSSSQTKAIKKFLERACNRPAGLLDVFQHYHYFASTILDRPFLLVGKDEQFHLTFHGADLLLDRVDRGQGCILLGAHLGSFEVVRASGLASRSVPIKLLMQEDQAPMLGEVLQKLDPSMSQSIISIGAPDAMLQVKDCVEGGGLVGILGDRHGRNDKIVQCCFLGELAPFPIGPMLLASLVKAPVILFFGVYRGGCHYEIFFELFSEQVVLDRSRREASLQEWTQRFVGRLEYYCRLAPHNWFNFYDVWEEDS